MQREIATKAFTHQLLSMASPKSAVHKTVKSKIRETMETLAHEFRNDPSLRVMNDALEKLKAKNPAIQPPAKPDKNAISALQRQKEEEELQMVLALSLSEANDRGVGQGGMGPNQSQGQGQGQGHGQPAGVRRSSIEYPPAPERQYSSSSAVSAAPSASEQKDEQPVKRGTTAASVMRVRALYDLTSTEEGELSFHKGDVIHVIESVYQDWWRGSLHGEVGIFPLNYVTPIAEPTQDDLRKEAEDELKVFAQARNIERLLAVLSSANPEDARRLAEDEELQNLYHTTLAIRPKLVRLIDKYSRKKEDLITLNEKFINARRVYDELMESSLAQYRHASPKQQRPRVSFPQEPGALPPYPLDPRERQAYNQSRQKRQSSAGAVDYAAGHYPGQPGQPGQAPVQAPGQAPAQAPAQAPPQHQPQYAQSPQYSVQSPPPATASPYPSQAPYPAHQQHQQQYPPQQQHQQQEQQQHQLQQQPPQTPGSYTGDQYAGQPGNPFASAAGGTPDDRRQSSYGQAPSAPPTQHQHQTPYTTGEQPSQAPEQQPQYSGEQHQQQQQQPTAPSMPASAPPPPPSAPAPPVPTEQPSVSPYSNGVPSHQATTWSPSAPSAPTAGFYS